MKPYRRKAQYYETDQMGVIHHSNYIRWFEEARVDLMEQMGFPFSRMEQEGLTSPLVSVFCEYKSMVRFEDSVNIFTTISEFNGVRMTVSYQVRDVVTDELRTLGETRHCFMAANGRPVSVKKANPELYQVFMATMTGQNA